MIDTSIDQSKICAPSAAYILGQVSSDLKAFNKLESSDIVRSLFGVEATKPNAIDITEALVTTIESKDQFKIRSLLQDRGISGVIWRFVSSKKFMVELSKAISSHGNFLSLSLITLNGEDGISTSVRELVRFNKDKTEFLDKRMRSVEYNTDSVDTIMEAHKQAVAELERKYLKPDEPTPAPVVPKDICHFDVTGLESYGAEEPVLCAHIWDPVGKIVENGVTDPNDILKWLVDNQPLTFEGRDVFYTVTREDDDSANGLYKIHVDLRAKVVEKEPEPEQPAEEVVQQGLDVDGDKPLPPEIKEELREQGVAENDIQAIEDGKVTVSEVTKLQEAMEETKEEWSQEEPGTPNEPVEVTITPDSNTEPESLPPPDPDDYPKEQPNDDDVIVVPKGTYVTFDILDEDRIAIKNCEGATITEFADADFKSLFVSDVMYDTLCDVTNRMLRDEIASNIASMFAEVKPAEPEFNPFHVTIVSGLSHELNHLIEDALREAFNNLSEEERNNVDKQFEVIHDCTSKHPDLERFEYKHHYNTNNFTMYIEEIVPEVNNEPKKKEEEPMSKYTVIVSDGLKDVEETITIELNNLTSTYGTNCEELTYELRAITEMEKLMVTFDEATNTFNVYEEQKEEVPGADIHDPEVQQGLLRGIFGVVDPAITHVQTFLRRHLKEIENPSYLATETFPTEVMQSWSEKPYNFTLSIVKFKDGRFYRIYLAVTNPGLVDQTWLATRDIPGRWIQIGRDISESTFRPDFQRRRRY